MESRVSKLSAKKLKAILIASIFVMLLIGAGIFWFFRERLVAFAVDVQTASVGATTSSSDVEKLRGIEAILNKDQDGVSRAKKIVAESKFYQYQDQIINDLVKYSQDAGVTITTFTFSEGSSTGSTTPAPTTEGAPVEPMTEGAPGEGTVEGGEASTTPAASSLKSTTVTVTIDSPVSYKKIMDFIHYIEENLTKMQLSGVTLSKATGEVKDTTVSVSPLVIEVYTK